MYLTSYLLVHHKNGPDLVNEHFQDSSVDLTDHPKEPEPMNKKLEELMKKNREHNRETVKSWVSEASSSLSVGRYNPLTKQI